MIKINKIKNHLFLLGCFLFFFLIFSATVYAFECKDCFEDLGECPPKCFEDPSFLENLVSDNETQDLISDNETQEIEADTKVESKNIIEDNKSLQASESEELKKLPEKYNKSLRETEGLKNPIFFMLLGLAAFIFIIFIVALIFWIIFWNKNRKIKEIKRELIRTSGINEKLFIQLAAYVKGNLNKGFDIGAIRRKLIEAGYNAYTIEKIIEYLKWHS